MNAGLSPAALDRLKQVDTPTVCNVIELFAVRPRTTGYTNDTIRACFPEMPAVVGYASTATWRAAAPPADGVDYGSLDAQVAAFGDVPGPPLVVFQDLDDPTAAASFGEMMCTVYRSFGAVGLVTSGAARDLDQVRALGFPAFSNGVIASHGYGHIVDIHVPVHIGGMPVHPGDLIHADCNGVTTVPNDIAADVIDACEGYAAAEQIVLDYVAGGEVTPTGLAEARKACGDAIRDLTARVRR